MVAQNSSSKSVMDILRSKKCTLSAEIIPPRNGAEPQQILDQIHQLKESRVDFVSVTKGAGGSLRGGTLPLAQVLQNRFDLCPIAHFTCRDETIEQIENSLMDHHYTGVHNILALRGDPPDGVGTDTRADSPASHMHQYAYQLIEQIAALNEGRYLARPGFDKNTLGPHPRLGREVRQGAPTHFCIGAAAYPEEALGAAYFLRKVEAGAHFGITQMIYSGEAYARFLDQLKSKGAATPILPGFRILSSLPTLQRMASKFQVVFPRAWTEAFEKVQQAPEDLRKSEGRKRGLELALNLAKDLMARGAPGLHLFIMNDAASACELIESLRPSERSS